MEAIAIEDYSNYNSALIQRYIDEKKRGLSLGRKKKIKFTLSTLSRIVFKKQFDNVTKDDLEDFVESVRNNDLGRDYEYSTRVDFLKISKSFFISLHPENDKFASWIRSGSYQPTVGPDDILTTEEKQRLRSVLLTPRDKTMFETLYESAARPKEFLGLLKSDVGFDQDSGLIHIRRGKTGYPRDITLVQDAFPLLRNWIYNEHPLRSVSDDFPLWVDMSTNSKREPLQQVGLRRFLERFASAAKIEKHITPYTLRHTRLTDLAREGANEALLCQIAGWKLGSKMPAVYIHLSKRDQKPALQKLLGIGKQSEEVQTVTRPKICSQCQTSNSSGANVCAGCRMPLDMKTSLEMIRLKQKVEEEKSKLEKRVEQLELDQRYSDERQRKQDLLLKETLEAFRAIKESQASKN